MSTEKSEFFEKIFLSPIFDLKNAQKRAELEQMKVSQDEIIFYVKRPVAACFVGKPKAK